jgi:hypothetical protein
VAVATGVGVFVAADIETLAAEGMSVTACTDVPVLEDDCDDAEDEFGNQGWRLIKSARANVRILRIQFSFLILHNGQEPRRGLIID